MWIPSIQKDFLKRVSIAQTHRRKSLVVKSYSHRITVDYYVERKKASPLGTPEAPRGILPSIQQHHGRLWSNFALLSFPLHNFLLPTNGCVHKYRGFSQIHKSPYLMPTPRIGTIFVRFRSRFRVSGFSRLAPTSRRVVRATSTGIFITRLCFWASWTLGRRLAHFGRHKRAGVEAFPWFQGWSI